MASIIAIQADEKFLDLASQKLQCFRDLFDIDSVNLILGKNGAGKTRLLYAIALAVTMPGNDDSSKLHLNKDLNGKEFEKHDLCSIYYSALQYKRKLPRRAGLIDASPSTRTHNRSEAVKLSQLGTVANYLGIDAKLIGVIGYPRSIFRSTLIPALRKNASRINSPTISMLVRKYREETTGTDSSMFNLTQKENYRGEALEELEYHIDQSLQLIGGFDQFLYLSALDYLHGNSKAADIEKFSSALLDYLGLISTNQDKSYFDQLEKIVENSREILSLYDFPNRFRPNEVKQSFTISSIGQLLDIRRYETPIKIEWNELSSGLHALVEQFALIGEAVAKAVAQGRFSILLLIDEGDAYLHLDWQRRYISLLNKYLGSLKIAYRLKSLQLVIASHSPVIAADLPGSIVKNLDHDMEIKTFAAPIEDVIARSFESTSIGEFAAKKINDIYARAKRSKLTEADRLIIESIGDDAIRAALRRETKNDN